MPHCTGVRPIPQSFHWRIVNVPHRVANGYVATAAAVEADFGGGDAGGPAFDAERAEAHNPAVTGFNPLHSTCFDGSETRVPSGYTKGRRLRTSAFSRSIASSGNDFRHHRPSLPLALDPPRDARWSDSVSPRRRDFGPNSRLSLRLAPPGLTSVAFPLVVEKSKVGFERLPRNRKSRSGLLSSANAANEQHCESKSRKASR
jgi:hypothetical protein